MKGLHKLDFVALLLVIIGGLNWGLVGLFQFDLVEFLLGSVPLLQRLIYVVVALAAIYSIARLPAMSHIHQGHWSSHEPHPTS